MPTPRFQLGDRVRVVRSGPNSDLVGVIIDVDVTRILPHYLVQFAGGRQVRFPEFDLAAVRAAERAS